MNIYTSVSACMSACTVCVAYTVQEGKPVCVCVGVGVRPWSSSICKLILGTCLNTNLTDIVCL